MILKKLKNTFLYLLIFLLGVKTTYAKTELILPQTAVSFSTKNTQIFTSLEKDELHISCLYDGFTENGKFKFEILAQTYIYICI